MLKSSLLLLAAVLLVVVCLPLRGGSPQQGTPAPAVTPQAAETPAAPTQAKNPVKPTAESQAKAKSIYQIDCALCHGETGSGKTDLATSMNLNLADWTNPATLANKTDADLFTIIRKGKDKMPPEDAARANDTVVWNLIIYVRSFSKTAAAAPAAPAGATATPQ
jgi:cytochrome c5